MADDDFADDFDAEQTLTIAIQDLQPRRAKACLIVLTGDSIGRIYRLEKSSIVIGRAADCDIVLTDAGVSRKHARLIQSPSRRVVLEDLGSRNGSFVNGEPCSGHSLNDGDRIQIGSITILKFSYQDELEDKLSRQLYESAVRDALTDAYNKRFFIEELGRAVSYARRRNEPLSIIVLDVDHFKRLNDTHGHLAGDAVLKQLAARLMATLRHEEVMCRIGGEEFAVIARGTNEKSAAVLAERLRTIAEETTVPYQATEIRATISLGFDTLGAHRTGEELVEAADRALYAAKRAGRNCVRSPRGSE
jgi:diguanylate cyclase (GGDEF)-like protein